MYIVKLRELRTMQLYYYTGRAGEAWLSCHRRDSFVYKTDEDAERTAARFRRQHPGHVVMTDYADRARSCRQSRSPNAHLEPR